MKSKNKSTPYLQFTGEVQSHTGRGKSLGFLTANMIVHPFPSPGIYISRTLVKDRWLPSVTFVGTPKTFSDDALERMETHILDGRYELVGTTITVELLVFIRENKKFPQVSELVQAIQTDIQTARDFFKNGTE